MATFRPIKKWLVPLLAIIGGFSIGFALFPTAQDHSYQTLVNLLDEASSSNYEVEAEYQFNNEIALTGKGYWSEELTKYSISSPVSDDTSFIFDIYLEGENFYVESDGNWSQATQPHSVIEQMKPLDDPFSWAKEILIEADQITRNKGEEVYTVYFEFLNDVDFMGYRLQEQESTELSISFSDDKIKEMYFKVVPVRPDDIGIFERYPELMTYDLRFSLVESAPPEIPPEAREAAPLD
ncbi:hypothetical protein CR194_15240 [Salipaludibacillus keqinensis]|uniref:Outer membrane lipoprotein carrier protein LolA n=1 Tax=Salipaludibacillus keqinensis TaxID=2045207 RepID=A0A323TD99_9BACI|nr:hypothetical protein [Salipaludibacillus keqinensis]PYZ92194.1 hypothetical protein CR194_15240 [Salipaludibacillus keqinensis]